MATGKIYSNPNSMTTLCDTTDLTYNSVDSYNCSWTGYTNLFFTLKYYGNHIATVATTKEWFNTTSNNNCVILSGWWNGLSSPALVYIYKNDDTHIYCYLRTNNSNVRILVYGI